MGPSPNRPLDSQTLAALHARIQRDGTPRVATDVGASLATIGRAAGGFPVHPLTMKAITRAVANDNGPTS